MGIDVNHLVESAGYLGLFLIVFAETGLLLGFFLPGDTLLITAGLVAQRGHLEIWWLLPLLIAAAFLGDATGFQIGKQAGPHLFKRDDSRFFKRKHLLRAEEFYKKHGGKTIVFARFIVVVRTFAPTVAGAANMPYPRFAMFNLAGGIAWVSVLLAAGYFVGSSVPDGLLEPLFALMVVVMVTLSVAPGLWHLRKERAQRQREERAAALATPKPSTDS